MRRAEASSPHSESGLAQITHSPSSHPIVITARPSTLGSSSHASALRVSPHRSALPAERDQVGYISVTPPTTSYDWLYISNHSPLHPRESTFIVFARFSISFVLSLFHSLASISFFIHPYGQYHEICAGWAVLPQWRPRRNSFQPNNGTTTAEGGPPTIICQDSSRRKWWWHFTQLVRHDV